jgi:hypothetical protein
VRVELAGLEPATSWVRSMRAAGAALGVAARLAERLDAPLVLAHVAEFALVPMPPSAVSQGAAIAPQPMTPTRFGAA